MLCFSQITYPKILSDSTVVITNQQLKEANKMFIQKDWYEQVNSELKQQLVDYKELVNNYEEIDSIRLETIGNLNDELERQDINNRILKFKNKMFGISTIILAVSTLFLIFAK